MINLLRIRNIWEETWKEMKIKVAEKEDKNGKMRNGCNCDILVSVSYSRKDRRRT
jgi:hypothetical protein